LDEPPATMNVPGLADSERPVTLSPRSAERLAALERMFKEAEVKLTDAGPAAAPAPAAAQAAPVPAAAPAPAAPATPMPTAVRRN
ncbi:MAG: penicillin-binding protein, partial [Rhizobiales bacterium]|nr:penicillin-binding protein [Hyphomicrobiales bacterium]